MNQTIDKFKEDSIRLYGEERKRNLATDPDESLVNKAFKKICDDWNGTEGSKKFLKHLIGSFCSDDKEGVEEINEQAETSRCCILGIRTTGKSNIAKKWKEILEKAGDSKDKLNKLTLRLPIEIKNGTVTVKSDRSSKLLSKEAWIALKEFVKRCDVAGVKEVSYIAHPKPKKKFKDHTTKAGLESFVTDEVWKKLKGLKK